VLLTQHSIGGEMRRQCSGDEDVPDVEPGGRGADGKVARSRSRAVESRLALASQHLVRATPKDDRSFVYCNIRSNRCLDAREPID
jgi:hypothetical protein